jgi:cytochrome c oxidase subunit 2
MNHIIGVIVVIIIGTLLAWAGLGAGFESLLPVRAAEEAAYVDRLLGMHFYVIAFLFVLIMGFMLYSVVAFRRRAGDTTDAQHIHGHTTLEIVWTIVPLGTVLYFSALGARYLNEITAPEPNEFVVEVISSQWNWRFDYPEYGISSAELYLPLNRQIRLEITSLDTLHSFWVPEFRIKQDAVPGAVNALRITPNLAGDFTILCAELCGKDHAYMTAMVHVLPDEEFQHWLDELLGPSDEELAAIERGRQLAEVNGCFKCHSTDGTRSDGPSWLGLYGEEVVLEDGTTVIADEDYIISSILNPQEQIVAGFTDVSMPATFGRVLSEEDVLLLAEFIESLGNE